MKITDGELNQVSGGSAGDGKFEQILMYCEDCRQEFYFPKTLFLPGITATCPLCRNDNTHPVI